MAIKPKQTILEYGLETFGDNFIDEYIDMQKTTIDISKIGRTSKLKMWVFCKEHPYHGSYEIACGDFYKGNRCSYCKGQHKIHPLDSFGQWLLDNFGHDALDKYWDYEKNGDLDPFSLGKQSNLKVWFKCPAVEYHESYEASIYKFYTGRRCPYCSHKKVHPKDSFAQYHIDNTDTNFLEKYWSDKNTVDPFKIQPCKPIKVWIKCQDDEEHEDYEMVCSNFTYGSRCPECNKSHGEREIRKYLNSHNINFISQKAFPNLVGIKDGSLTYDFYILDQNLLIEYQGEYHDGTAYQQSEEDYLKQQEHDRRKREYAEQNGIRLLEIWYWDYDNIEEILNKNIK